MAGDRKYANFVTTKLTAQLLAAGVTANVTAGDGALFAAANGTDFMYGVLRRMSGYRDVAHEIVKITNRATDALTIVRAQEGTTGLQFEIGDQLDIEVTAASLTAVEAAWTAFSPTIIAGSGTFTAVAGAGRYRQVGKTVNFTIIVTVTTQGTAATWIDYTLPVTAQAATGAVVGVETSANVPMLGRIFSTTHGYIWRYDGVFVGASGTTIQVSGTYEAA